MPALAIFLTFFITVGPLALFFLVRASDKKERRASKRYRVEATKYDKDDAMYKFVMNIKKTKQNTNDIEVNTRLVRECTQVLSPVTASVKDIITLHRCLSGFNEFDLIIKMSVHYNLFSRAIKALGTNKHLNVLKSMTKNEEIGSFALTERGAGVLSGFVVETVATYDKDSNHFIINSPNARARKYWISQGKTCDYMVVYCDLMYENKSYGIHAFLIKMKDYNVESGEFGFIDKFISENDVKNKANTILIENVPDKNCIIGTDNVIIHFNTIVASADSLLDRHYTIEDMLSSSSDKNKKKPPSFLKQMNSLISGRICIAAGELELLKVSYMYVEKYVSNERDIYIGDKSVTMPLGKLSHIKKSMNNIKYLIEKMEIYLNNVENEFINIMENQNYSQYQNVSYQFLKKVNICKAFIPIHTIKFMREMSNLIGAKMYDIDSPLFMVEKCFVGTIAEGDSILLAIKLAVDQLKYSKTIYFGMSKEELKLKIDFLLNKSNISKWYVNNTDKLLTFGMKIAQNEIKSVKKPKH